MIDDRQGAKQVHRFDPARAYLLDDETRETWLPASELFTLLDAPEHSRVVDFGAGTGHHTFKLAAARQDLRIFAVDEQVPMLDVLRERKAAFRAYNVEVIDAPEFAEMENVDAILAVNVLHELGEAALESLVAALDERGVALFADWNGGVERPVGPPRDHVYTLAEAKKRLANAGFIVHFERVMPYHYVLRARLYR